MILQYCGKGYNITTQKDPYRTNTVIVKSYADVLAEHRYHPEPKCADASGAACGKQTKGLLQRRAAHMAQLRYVGKESNKLEEMDAGLVHDWDEVRNIYNDPEDAVWETEILPRLKEIPAKELAKAAGISVRAVKAIRNGHAVPQPKTRAALGRAAMRIDAMG